MRLVTTGTMPQREQTWKSALRVPKAYVDTSAGSSIDTCKAPRGFEVQTPPCLVQNEQPQARAWISVGSGSQVSVKEMFPQWHLPRINTVRLDLYQPLAVDQPLHFHERARRFHLGKHLAMCARRFFPTRDIGQHDSRADHALQAEAGVRDRLGNDFEAALRLAVDIAGCGDAAVGRDRRRARDRHDRADAHRARKTDARLERRSGRDELTHNTSATVRMQSHGGCLAERKEGNRSELRAVRAIGKRRSARIPAPAAARHLSSRRLPAPNDARCSRGARLRKECFPAIVPSPASRARSRLGDRWFGIATLF